MSGIREVGPQLTSHTSTLTIDLQHTLNDTDEIKHIIAQRLNVEKDTFHILCGTRPLRSSDLVDPSSSSSDPLSPLFLRLLPLRSGLLGGKGGFGSLLRSATTKVGAKKTSNFSASRDLSGRRMRHVEAEQKIAEWNAQQHEEINQAGRGDIHRDIHKTMINKTYALHDTKDVNEQQQRVSHRCCVWGCGRVGSQHCLSLSTLLSFFLSPLFQS